MAVVSMLCVLLLTSGVLFFSGRCFADVLDDFLNSFPSRWPVFTRLLLQHSWAWGLVAVVFTTWACLLLFRKCPTRHVALYLIFTAAVAIMFHIWGVLAVVVPMSSLCEQLAAR